MLETVYARLTLTTFYTPSAAPASGDSCAWRCYSTSAIGLNQPLCSKSGATATRTPVVGRRAFHRLQGREIVNNSTLTSVSITHRLNASRFIVGDRCHGDTRSIVERTFLTLFWLDSELHRCRCAHHHPTSNRLYSPRRRGFYHGVHLLHRNARRRRLLRNVLDQLVRRAAFHRILALQLRTGRSRRTGPGDCASRR